MNRWQNTWFINLHPNAKLLFIHVNDNCDDKGLFEVSMTRLRVSLKPFTDCEIKAAFKDINECYTLSADRKTIRLKGFKSGSLPDALTLFGNKKISAYKLIADYWLNEMHKGWTFGSQHGKELKEIIKKIRNLLTSPEQKPDDETIFGFFKVICQNLPEWYKQKDLGIINSKFNELITEIKKGQNGNKVNSRTSKYTSSR